MPQEWILEPKYVGWLLQGFGVTLALAATVIVTATVSGFALAMAHSADAWLVRRVAAAYVLVFRNSPLLVQLMFWYFGAATLLPDGLMQWLNAPHAFQVGALSLRWPPFEFVAGWIGLTFYSCAFVGEEFRAGLRGVSGGQRQAAAALGLTRWQAFRHVVLPQAARNAMPPLFGQYMNIVKNSSLTMAIGLAELSYASRQVETETFKTFAAFGVATALYIGTIAVIEALAHVVQRRHPAARAG